MHPGWQGAAVHEAPFECRFDKAQHLLNTGTPPVGRWDITMGSGNSPWLKARKVGAHLVATALLCPRFDGSIVRMKQYQIVLFFSALRITN